MSRATSLVNRVAGVLDKVNANDRVTYKRRFTHSGGDALTGRGVSTGSQDILLAPQPAVRALGPYDSFYLNGNSVVQSGDQVCTVSSLAITRDELADKDMALVMKDALGNEEEFFLCAFNPSMFGGTDVVFELLIRSKSRPS